MYYPEISVDFSDVSTVPEPVEDVRTAYRNPCFASILMTLPPGVDGTLLAIVVGNDRWVAEHFAVGGSNRIDTNNLVSGFHSIFNATTGEHLASRVKY